MKQLLIKRNIVLLAVVAAAFAVTAPLGLQHVSARDGADDMVAQTAQPTTDDSPEDETGDDAPRLVRTRVLELEDKAKTEVEKRREGRKELAEDKRKLVCENRQAAIENKLAAFNQAADKHLAKLDGVFVKLQDYQKVSNVPVANFDELVAAATEKQTAAKEAVDALKLIAVDVDCSNPDTVVKLSTVREAAKVTRTALHDYRMALKDIVVALAQAKDGGEDDSDGAATENTDSTDTTDNTSTEGAN